MIIAKRLGVDQLAEFAKAEEADARKVDRRIQRASQQKSEEEIHCADAQNDDKSTTPV